MNEKPAKDKAMNEDHFSKEERKTLLDVARNAIGRKLGKEPASHEVTPTPKMEEKRGAFVTLHKKGGLRGCIGRFTSDHALPKTIEEMARAAAFEDPRFPPLSPAELADIDLEISVLTPMTRVSSVDEIEVGRHGIFMQKGYRRGVLLPQVATEHGWDRKTFLEHTCLKAGMSSNCWQDPDLEIYVFSAEIFGEKDLG